MTFSFFILRFLVSCNQEIYVSLADVAETLWKNVIKSFPKCLREKVLMIRLRILIASLPECRPFHKSQCPQGNAANCQSAKKRDADEGFANSIVPILKKLPAKKNRLARIEIQQVLLKYEFDDNS